MSGAKEQTAFIVGASRGLGRAIVQELLERGWCTIATVRAGSEAALDDLKRDNGAALAVKTLDINDSAQLAVLRRQLAGRRIDLLFVNAGTTTSDEHVHVGKVDTEEFVRVMITNALSPMRVIEAVEDLVPAGGLIGAMSSGQGSIANNETGLREVYRGSKAALNMFMRSFAARQSDLARALVVMAPGWVRTELGGPGAVLEIADSVPSLVSVLLDKIERPGLEFLDYQGRTVPW
jgi:NAD(P)-dependent dehydrogenase (short-subunit alcohol dehydrogenase family)